MVDGLLRKAPAVPQIAGWELLGVLGRGGMGTVWRARRSGGDEALAAVKFPKYDDVAQVERIKEEAASLRALDHPNIVRLIETGDMPDGGLFLVMQYIEGASLDHGIPAAGLPPERAFAIFRQVAGAVQHAHDRGVIHRDLKPGNILIAEDGSAHVADFGLARPVHERVLQLSLTTCGTVAGTAEYLPPEAFYLPYEPDFRGDVYALGVLLYEMLAGAPPRGAWVPVSEKKRVDIRVDEVLRRALSPVPKERWQTAAAMTAALEEIHRTPPRYSGAPMLTRAVRAADFAWTVLALLVHFALIGVLLRQVLSKVAWPLDLIGTEELRTGGFQSLFFTLMALVPVSVWQLVRLWRFRSVPLREALPVPFGLRLGGSKTAAAIVLAGQLACIVAPAWLALRVWSHCGRTWVGKGQTIREAGLLVTEQHGERPISPWDFPGVDTWLYSRTGYPGEPGGRVLGRISFFPGGPQAMVISSTLLALALLAPALVMVRRQLRVSFVKAVPLTLAMSAVVAASFSYYASYRRHADNPRLTNAKEHLLDTGRVAALLHLTAWPSPTTPPAEALNAYAEEVDYLAEGPLPRATVAQRLIADAEAGRAVRRHREEIGGGPHHALMEPTPPWPLPIDKKTTAGGLTLAEFTDPPTTADGHTPLATGAICHIGYQFRLARNAPLIAERFASLPMYSAEQRRITPAEADKWARAFIDAVQRGMGTGLDGADPLVPMILPRVFSYTVNGKGAVRESGVRERSTLIEMLRTYRLPVFPMAALPVTEITTLPGARNRITYQVHYIPERADPWTVDLVFVEGRWQCARLDL